MVERGVDADALVRQRQLTGRTREQDLTASDRTMARVFDRLAGPDGLTAQASTFARHDIIAALGGELAGATRTQLEERADRFLTGRTVAVVDPPYWSTAMAACGHPEAWPQWPSSRPLGRGYKTGAGAWLAASTAADHYPARCLAREELSRVA